VLVAGAAGNEMFHQNPYIQSQCRRVLRSEGLKRLPPPSGFKTRKLGNRRARISKTQALRPRPAIPSSYRSTGCRRN